MPPTTNQETACSVRAVRTGPGTHCPYVRPVRPKSIACKAFLPTGRTYGYVQAVRIGDRYALAVRTGAKIAENYTRTYGPYVRPVRTGRTYG